MTTMQRITPYCGQCGHQSDIHDSRGICTYCHRYCTKFPGPAGHNTMRKARPVRLGTFRRRPVLGFNTLVGGLSALTLGISLGGLYTGSGNATGLFVVALLSSVCFFAALDR